MTTESVLSQWFRRVWNENDIRAMDELASPDVISHGLTGNIHGLENWKKTFHQPMLATFTHTKIGVVEEVEADDKIFARLTATLSVTGHTETVQIKGTCMMHIKKGKIVEAWDSWDFLSLLEGLKYMPASSFQKALTGQLKPHPEV